MGKPVPVPDATPLSPSDWGDLIRDVADTYDEVFLTEEERANQNKMATAEDLRAFAEYIVPVLETQI
jgi:hypothetical protein